VIGPALLAAIDLTFDVLEAGAHGVQRAKKFWRVVRPPPEEPPPGALPFSAVEHQRAQMRSATTQGTVTGPSNTTDPRSRLTILPPKP
jgi:hypothetical protein